MKIKPIAVFTLFILLVTINGCSGRENNEENEQPENNMPGEIERIEEIALKIMQQADIIPVVRMTVEEPGNENQEKIVTFEETLLGEVLDKEMNNQNEEETQEHPENPEAIWDNIKEEVTKLYQHWDELKLKMARERIFSDTIYSFEETMDSLTISIAEEKQFDTLSAANQLTVYLAKFMAPFAENALPSAYELKHHTRKIVLLSATKHYTEAQKRLDLMEMLMGEILNDLDDLEASEKAEKLEMSLHNLQRVVYKENLDLIKMHSAVFMENITEVIQELEQL